jgi:hypothetical protein
MAFTRLTMAVQWQGRVGPSPCDIMQRRDYNLYEHTVHTFRGLADRRKPWASAWDYDTYTEQSKHQHTDLLLDALISLEYPSSKW